MSFFSSTAHKEQVMKDLYRGFTLIELMIVIAIFAIIAVVVIPSFVDYNKRRDGQLIAEYLMREHIAKTDPALRDVAVSCSMNYRLQDGFTKCSGQGDTPDKEFRRLFQAMCPTGNTPGSSCTRIAPQ